MTQKTSDLLAELEKKDLQFIPADSLRAAIDSIEATMGKCWTHAKGSRHVAHQMLDDDYIFVTMFYSSVKGEYVDQTYVTYNEDDAIYVAADGELLKPVKGYRPMTVAERHEQMSRTELKRLRRKAEKAKPRHHREGSSRAVKRRLEPAFTSEKRFGHLVARLSGVSRNPSGPGDLLLG